MNSTRKERAEVKERALTEGQPTGAQRLMVDAVDWMADRVVRLEKELDELKKASRFRRGFR